MVVVVVMAGLEREFYRSLMTTPSKIGEGFILCQYQHFFMQVNLRKREPPSNSVLKETT
jgi:hypothetical protein